jgi:hypothetical protein
LLFGVKNPLDFHQDLVLTDELLVLVVNCG